MIKEIYRKITKHKWELGFVENSLSEVLQGEPLRVRWVKHHYTDRWFADPFILNVSDTDIVLLVEEFCYQLKRGRIAKLVIDRETCELKRMKIVLDLPTHLSFPAIYRDNGKVYIYPENHDSGELKLYLYDDATETCRFERLLCKEPLTDAVYTTLFGEKMIFSTKIPTQNGGELDIYAYNDATSLYELKDSCHFNENIARMAGDFFVVQNDIYRPAQESNHSYGHAVSIQKVSRRDSHVAFEECVRLYSPHPDLQLGMHTFNVFGGMVVVDVKGYVHPGISRILSKVKNLVR